MKPHQATPVFRVLFNKCYRYHQRCHLPFLAKKSAFLVELNILQHSCRWKTVTSVRTFHYSPTAFRTHWDNDTLQAYLQTLNQEYEKIDLLLNSCSVNEFKRKDLSQRLAELSPFVKTFQEIQEAEKQIQELERMCTELTKSEEQPLLELAVEEKEGMNQKIRALYLKLCEEITPREKYDESSVLLEVTSGRTTGGGLHHAAACILGSHVYRHLKFEGGTHRVQRIPQTGLSSRMQRIHTGTMTVIVLPLSEEVQIKINPSDLRIDTFRAKGAGGQHVNKTESAVRVVHIPTGISVECQQDRSQLMNKETALQTLREKLYLQSVMKEINEQQSTRRLQLGTRAQSERIRTYNFNQDRVTDHRISYEVRDIKEFLNGKEHLDNLISRLLEASQMKLLTEHLENNLKSL
ncbi:peptide chain release factor 1, mitochondrial isoform X2 [Python bivittatus]|uniref:Peptide chain release factor 1, mitochondrial isoform X2 n=1 Tax=Python bivittatus TaxID=176946 RepID=A0A9F5JBG7_PYTBI|nr:peptide chain release factor 1, mitochondrial isoform X2 [Python bivittatus]